MLKGVKLEEATPSSCWLFYHIEHNKGVIMTSFKDKIDEMANLIADPKLKAQLKRSLYIAGGAIASKHLGQTPRDFDMYVRSMSLAMKLRAYFQKENIPGVTVTEKAIKFKESGISTKWAGSPRAIVTGFDFKHNWAWYAPGEGVVILPEAKSSILTRQLKYNKNAASPHTGPARVEKFKGRGWKITDKEMSLINRLAGR